MTDPADARRQAARAALQPGDPWTFIRDGLPAVEVGTRFGKVYGDNPDALWFEIVACHPNAYEARFIGIRTRPVPDQPAQLASPGAAVEPVLVQAEIARERGFTGDSCSTCGSFEMRRAGTCLACTACGSTTGCS